MVACGAVKLRPPPPPPRGLDGLPLADEREARVARVVVIVASAWFALAACWELFGPMLAGHYASSASVGIIAENMLRWKIAGPVWEYTATKPGPEMYYCHHPFGIFWTTAVLMKLLGRHDFICRLAPVLLSVATPPLLGAIGRAVWRPAAGAIAAAAFVVLPIDLAFAQFNALEVPVIAWSLLALWGAVRLSQTGKRRFLAASAFGALAALHADWPAFILVGELLALWTVRLFVLGPRAVEPPIADMRRFAQQWALWASAAVLTAVYYLAVFQKSGKLGDFLGAGTMRSAGSEAPLAAVLASRRYWIELCFTPIAIALGKLGAVVSAVRLVALRREHEAIPLAVLVMATVQYVVFRQGADIHVFWPHYFAAYFALAMGALFATLAPGVGLLRRLVARARRLPLPAFDPRAGKDGVIALGVLMLPVLAIARDGVPALRYARETGGRFNEKGLLIHSDGAKTAFLKWLDGRIPKDARIEMHEGFKPTWSQTWTLRRVTAIGRPAPRPGRVAGGVFLADTRFLLDDQQAGMVEGTHVVAVGPFWYAVPGEAPAPIDAFAIHEREPGPLEWYFVSGTEPHRDVAPDPFLTWELRAHFGQMAVPPTAEPSTFEERRIAHNVAVARGDSARAAALAAELEKEVTPLHAAFDDGSEIVGARYHEGARSLLTLLVRAGGPTKGDVQLTVKSRVTARAPLSTTMPDPTEREVGLPLAIAPQRWRKGFLYADAVPIRKRPGTEVFRASFWSRDRSPFPRPVSGAPVDVLTLR
jgi:4-amino-4-deoxy-L-arabinose transferase-like glycosyltransferase